MTNQALVNSIIKKFGPDGGYKDLGLVIDATNMAAGATVTSSLISNTEWVRNIVLSVTSDQQYDILYLKGNSTGVVETSTSGTVNQTATGAGIRAHTFSGQNGVVGASFKVSLKNSSASPNTVGKVYAQLMGL